MNSFDSSSSSTSPDKSTQLYNPLKSLDTNCLTILNIKTSNYEIFPSLHPMSDLYRGKQNTQKNFDNIDNQCWEISKKRRCNDSLHKIIPRANNNTPKKIHVKDMKTRMLPSYNIEQPIFEIPSFERIEKFSQSLKQDNLIEMPEKTRVLIEPLTMPRSRNWDREMYYFSQSSCHLNDHLKQILTSNAKNSSDKNQTHRISDHFLDLQILDSLYRNLKTEFRTLQARQIFLKAQQIKQENYTDIRQEMNLVLQENNLDKIGKIEYSETNSVSIKQEHIKQENEK